jgi:hypothetical protein
VQESEQQPAADAVISPIRIRELIMENRHGEPATRFNTGDDIHVRVVIDSDIPKQPIHVMAGVSRAADEMQCFAVGTFGDGLAPISGRSAYDVIIKLHDVPLLRGEYAIVVFVGDENAIHAYDRKDLRPAFSMEGERYEIGMLAVDHEWEIGSRVANLAQ